MQRGWHGKIDLHLAFLRGSSVMAGLEPACPCPTAITKALLARMINACQPAPNAEQNSIFADGPLSGGLKTTTISALSPWTKGSS
jgi:hypothetical protein